MTYKCNLLIPGAPKSGTTALHAALATHPQICMSRPKEPWFFFGDRFEGGAARHNALFAHAEDGVRVFGESSQGYFADPQSTSRIAESLDTPKIILLLRHPVERALSQYRYDVRRGIETDPLEVALRERGDDPVHVWDDRIGFYRNLGGHLAFSRYTRLVPAWQSRFGADNVLVLRTEDMAADRAAVLARCHAFLGLPEITSEAMAETRNATADTRRKVMPGPVRVAARLVPGGLKTSPFYRRMRDGMRRAMTPRAPDRPGTDALQRMTRALSDDIAFHAGLAARADHDAPRQAKGAPA
ncbi:sulfotransferase [Salibaculum sp.]|uniref:sulfotransferase family protein n=1 Tax=Salibaculum sp. TaxID=2855480 RepID=UPI002B470A91|nr:sulfotransferase [Salibaculum sp.]